MLASPRGCPEGGHVASGRDRVDERRKRQEDIRVSAWPRGPTHSGIRMASLHVACVPKSEYSRTNRLEIGTVQVRVIVNHPI